MSFHSHIKLLKNHLNLLNMIFKCCTIKLGACYGGHVKWWISLIFMYLSVFWTKLSAFCIVISADKFAQNADNFAQNTDKSIEYADKFV